jgi:hypothetical protein
MRAGRPTGDGLIEERVDEARSDERSAQSIAGVGPEKSSLTGVQRARPTSESVIGQPDQESADDQ